MVGNGSWIQTSTCLKFDLINPTVDMVRPADIAHALANICRFTGHVKRFYSVAEHSLFCSMLAPEGFALEALLHDAPEAYYGDINRPFKRLLQEHDAALFTRIDCVVRQALHLRQTEPEEIKVVDNRMLITERNALFDGASPDAWSVTGKPYELDWTLGVEPERAETLFKARWKVLDPIVVF